ncbi:hypothetical protein SALBM135S_00328 [Streptomyces alboniger]
MPALDLPVRGALAQILLFSGIAEIRPAGGARSSSGTWPPSPARSTRLGIAPGPDHPIGLPASDARVVDTGPSAARRRPPPCTVRLRYRAFFTAALVTALMVVELMVKDNLAGKEHLAAIAAVLVLCALPSPRRRRGGGRSGPRQDRPSDEAPPTQPCAAECHRGSLRRCP